LSLFSIIIDRRRDAQRFEVIFLLLRQLIQAPVLADSDDLQLAHLIDYVRNAAVLQQSLLLHSVE